MINPGNERTVHLAEALLADVISLIEREIATLEEAAQATDLHTPAEIALMRQDAASLRATLDRLNDNEEAQA